MTIWIKDGKFFNGRLELDGKIIFIDGEPPAELMIRAGYKKYIPPTPQPTPVDLEFEQIKSTFWGYVDEAAEALSEATGQTYTRADFPTTAFSSQLLAWCVEHGMSEDMTGTLAIKFCGIAADLARVNHNWNDLFDQEVPEENENQENPIESEE